MIVHAGNVSRHALVLGAILFAPSACDGVDPPGPTPAVAAEASQPEPAPDPAPTPAPPDPAMVGATLTRAEVPAPAAQPIPSAQADATAAVRPLSPMARTEDERNSTSVFKAAAPATVFVTQSQVVYDRFSMRATEVPAGTGTGFIWDKDGHIVTNCHVALPNCEPRAKPKLQVTLYDQKNYPAKVVGFDPAKDIAVLKIDAPEDLTPIRRPAKGYQLEVGQKTLAIGNPFGLDHTLTVGVVSALDREVKGVGNLTIRNMVQTDAAINPGNSGGPLLNSSGELIGMNTMIFSASGSSAGIGFAVPVPTIERLVPQLIRSGGPERVGFGFTVAREGLRRQLGIEGVIVERVQKGSPAAKAGLRSIAETRTGLVFDAVVAVDETRIKNFDDLYGALEAKQEGDVVTVMVRHFPSKTVETIEVELARLR